MYEVLLNPEDVNSLRKTQFCELGPCQIPEISEILYMSKMHCNKS